MAEYPDFDSPHSVLRVDNWGSLYAEECDCNLTFDHNRDGTRVIFHNSANAEL